MIQNNRVPINGFGQDVHGDFLVVRPDHSTQLKLSQLADQFSALAQRNAGVTMKAHTMRDFHLSLFVGLENLPQELRRQVMAAVKAEMRAADIKPFRLNISNPGFKIAWGKWAMVTLKGDQEELRVLREAVMRAMNQVKGALGPRGLEKLEAWQNGGGFAPHFTLATAEENLNERVYQAALDRLNAMRDEVQRAFFPQVKQALRGQSFEVRRVDHLHASHNWGEQRGAYDMRTGATLPGMQQARPVIKAVSHPAPLAEQPALLKAAADRKPSKVDKKADKKAKKAEKKANKKEKKVKKDKKVRKEKKPAKTKAKRK